MLWSKKKKGVPKMEDPPPPPKKKNLYRVTVVGTDIKDKEFEREDFEVKNGCYILFNGGHYWGHYMNFREPLMDVICFPVNNTIIEEIKQ